MLREESRWKDILHFVIMAVLLMDRSTDSTDNLHLICLVLPSTCIVLLFAIPHNHGPMLAFLPNDLSNKTIEFLLTNQGGYYFACSSWLSQAILSDETTPFDILTGKDIFAGAIRPLVLAFTISFLQSQWSQNDFVLWESSLTENPSAASWTATSSHVFGGDACHPVLHPFHHRQQQQSPVVMILIILDRW